MNPKSVCLRVVSAIVLLSVLVGCASPAPSTPITTVPPANKAGNLAGGWLLLGNMPLYFVANNNTNTNVAVSIAVSGTTITGSANVQSVCAAGGAFSWGYVGVLSGTVNQDGTFSLGFNSLQLPAQSMTIQGTVPTSAGQSWSGKITYNSAAGNGTCATSFSNTFNAAPVSTIAGTFTGSGDLTYAYVTAGLAPSVGTPYSMSLSLNQSGVGVQSPLTGTIKLSGFSCFTSGTQSSVVGSDTASNMMNLNFTMDDGASVSIAGSVNNTSATQLAVSGIYVRGDSCTGNYYVATDTSQISNPLLLDQ